MPPDAEAFVIVADLDHAHRVGGILRQPSQVETVASLGLSDVLRCHGQMFLNDMIDALLDLPNRVVGGRLREFEIELTLLFLDVSRNGTTAPEEANHRLIDNVFGRVHGGIFFFIVLVELWSIVHDCHYLSSLFQQKIVSERNQNPSKLNIVVQGDREFGAHPQFAGLEQHTGDDAMLDHTILRDIGQIDYD